MGHWHFWTTPEEVGECQPLKLNGLPFRIVLDGRIDNRAELLAQVGISSAEGKSLSDAALILQAYARWGEACIEHFIGEYALVILDELQDQMLLARDALGTRTLFYARYGTQIIIASEAWAVAGGGPLEPEINERAAALFFAFEAPADGQTLFKGIDELLPGHALVIKDSVQRLWQYWQPDLSKKLHYHRDAEYSDHFLFLLEESVSCRLRSTTPVGVMMSGGLDSTTVACLAARRMAPRQLTTISYVFDDFPNCDERYYIDAVTSQYNTYSIQIPCDDLFPFHNWPDWTVNPNFPVSNFYAPIRERAHQRAHQEGIRVLLTGDFGDHLYSGGEDWLADLLQEWRLGDAGREIGYHLREPGLTRNLTQTYLRRLARRALDSLPFGQRLRRPSQPPEWLTSFAARFWRGEHSTQTFIPNRLVALTGNKTARISAMGPLFSSQAELELRSPYRDQRLVEFMAAIPAHQLYQRGVNRVVLRHAMQGILPERIRMRSGKTSLLAIFLHGLERRRNDLIAFFSDQNGGLWRNYVDPGWLESRWSAVFTASQDGAAKAVPWQCVAYDLWYKHVKSFS
jgi:asparagine synthase (glutamine-hydrolysing)